MKRNVTVIGVRELRAHLSACLRRVARGETVVIGDRRRHPIARLTPIERDQDLEWLESLAERGIVRRPTTALTLPKRIKLKGQGKLGSEMLLEDRGPK